MVKRLLQLVNSLRKELKGFNNSNSPPAQRATNKTVQDKKRRSSMNTKSGKKGKKGGQKGHKGKTNKPKPDREEDRTLDECNNCGDKNLEVTGKKMKTVTRVKRPVEYEHVLYIIWQYYCKKCNRHVCNSKGIPKRGQYDVNIQAQVAILFLNHLPYRLMAREFARMGLKMSFATVCNTKIHRHEP